MSKLNISKMKQNLLMPKNRNKCQEKRLLFDDRKIRNTVCKQKLVNVY